MRTLATSTALAALLLVGASAQQPSPTPPDNAAAEASIHGYGDRESTCQEWTDGCRTCTRPETGEPVCSNIGPACQPVAITCSRRATAK